MRCCFGFAIALWTLGCAATRTPAATQGAPSSSASALESQPAPRTPSAAAPDVQSAEALSKQADELCDHEDWEQCILVLERLVRVEPGETRHGLRLGQIYLRVAEKRKEAPPAAARQPLERCIELVPDHAECHFTLARVLDWQEEPGLALQHYFAALRKAPTVSSYYVWPADLCVRYKLYDTATGIIDAGLAQPPNDAEEGYLLRVSQFQVAQARDDNAGMVAAMEGAYVVGGALHPEISFNLGSTYAVATPVRKREAIGLLREFVMRVCRGAQSSHYKEQCETAQSLLQKFGAKLPKRGEAGFNLQPITLPPKPSVPPPLPAAPQVPDRLLRQGDAYTVYGASLRLRSQRQHPEMKGAEISVTGIIGKSNLSEAPRCALHQSGVADPEGCEAPVPTFWLCDTLDAPLSDCIRVIGWASNYAQIWDAILESRKPGSEPRVDDFWGQVIPLPIPQKGAKIIITGSYGFVFSGATLGVAEFDPIMGILSYKQHQWIQPPPDNPNLPGMQ
jgi:hypothetical protein